jgi:hypothetical protein
LLGGGGGKKSTVQANVVNKAPTPEIVREKVKPPVAAAATTSKPSTRVGHLQRWLSILALRL